MFLLGDHSSSSVLVARGLGLFVFFSVPFYVLIGRALHYVYFFSNLGTFLFYLDFYIACSNLVHRFWAIYFSVFCFVFRVLLGLFLSRLFDFCFFWVFGIIQVLKRLFMDCVGNYFHRGVLFLFLLLFFGSLSPVVFRERMEIGCCFSSISQFFSIPRCVSSVFAGNWGTPLCSGVSLQS